MEVTVLSPDPSRTLFNTDLGTLAALFPMFSTWLGPIVSSTVSLARSNGKLSLCNVMCYYCHYHTTNHQ